MSFRVKRKVDKVYQDKKSKKPFESIGIKPYFHEKLTKKLYQTSVGDTT